MVTAIVGVKLQQAFTRFISSLTFVWFLNTVRSEEHTSEFQSQSNLVCRLLLEKKKKKKNTINKYKTKIQKTKDNRIIRSIQEYVTQYDKYSVLHTLISGDI